MIRFVEALQDLLKRKMEVLAEQEECLTELYARLNSGKVPKKPDQQNSTSSASTTAQMEEKVSCI